MKGSLGAPIFAGALLLAAIGSAVAAGAFDGRWSVTLHTDDGSCGSARTVAVNVADGHATYAGPEQVTASGVIPDTGKVSLRFAYKDDTMDARGSVRGGVGNGSWVSNGGCRGSWSAHKS